MASVCCDSCRVVLLAVVAELGSVPPTRFVRYPHKMLYEMCLSNANIRVDWAVFCAIFGANEQVLNWNCLKKG